MTRTLTDVKVTAIARRVVLLLRGPSARARKSSVRGVRSRLTCMVLARQVVIGASGTGASSILMDADVTAIAHRVVQLLRGPEHREKPLPFETMDRQTRIARAGRSVIGVNRTNVSRGNAHLQDMPKPMLRALLKLQGKRA